MLAVSHEVRLEDEVVVDAMCEVGFVHFATSVRLRRNDVVFGLRKVEPVFRSMIELEANLGSAVALGNAITQAGIEHLTFTLDGVLKRIAHQTSKRCCLAVGTHADPVATYVQIELT